MHTRRRHSAASAPSVKHPGVRGMLGLLPKPLGADSDMAEQQRAQSNALRRLRRQITRLCGEHSGYLISGNDARAVRATKGSPTYGEITVTSLARLLDYLQLTPDDVFYDLGSGIGKVVLQVAMTCDIRRVVGIEMAPGRHRAATEILARARGENLLQVRDCELIQGNFLERSLADATVIYSCSTAFSETFMRRLVRKLGGLKPGLRFASSRALLSTGPFEQLDRLVLDMSWKRRSPIYVYQLSGG